MSFQILTDYKCFDRVTESLLVWPPKVFSFFNKQRVSEGVFLTRVDVNDDVTLSTWSIILKVAYLSFGSSSLNGLLGQEHADAKDARDFFRHDD